MRMPERVIKHILNALCRWLRWLVSAHVYLILCIQSVEVRKALHSPLVPSSLSTPLTDSRFSLQFI